MQAQTFADGLFSGAVPGENFINDRRHLPTERFKILLNAAEGGLGIGYIRA
ncbi:hypothetical protein [Arthrobacter sp. PAMC25284]|uniref:hypothetical protein n=1 Tax=Arthrobacter sp. PAMC25284 TaxID=2861279 RepID=UPI001C63A06C|nr:hypothetical protein [Arthrobacter sp. PAMC25284]QYF91155.1 hypothetical protein KY499_08235 [Arthrobacter sp. PAMC25284]